MVSIFQKERECYVCKTTKGLHLHHIFFGTGNRRVSDANGFTCYLCGKHHNLSDLGVHFNTELDSELKQKCQAKYEETHTREEFMKLIGRNYLDESDNEDTRDGNSAEDWLHGIGF